MHLLPKSFIYESFEWKKNAEPIKMQEEDLSLQFKECIYFSLIKLFIKQATVCLPYAIVDISACVLGNSQISYMFTLLSELDSWA